MVLQSTDPLTLTDQDSGLLRFASSRPMLRLQMNQVWLPLAVNSYTGGIADWPARLLTYAGIDSTDGRWLYSIWSGLLCIFVLQIFRNKVGFGLALWIGISIALSWDLMLYRVALAGTEQLLYSAWVFALLLSLNASKIRQWWLVVACGFHAKITFGLSLAPMLLFSKDRQKIKRFWLCIVAGSLSVLPMLLVIPNTKLPSHDSLEIQYERVLLAFQGANTSPRETWAGLWYWLTNPSEFWANMYTLPSGYNFGIRPICILMFSVLAALVWKHKSQFSKSFRELSLIILGQAFLLSWIAKDIHHFGVLSITLSFWVGLLAAHIFTKSDKRYHFMIKTILVLWPIGQIVELIKTPEQFKHIQYHGISIQAQKLACETLIRNDVKRVTTLDYDIYGVFETLCPEVSVTHGWGVLAQHRSEALGGLLTQADGAHLLVFPDSRSWTYNLKPSLEQLENSYPDAKFTQLESEPFCLYSITNKKQETNK